MPEQGWRSISVKEEVYEELERRAEAEHRKVGNVVEKILMEALHMKEVSA